MVANIFLSMTASLYSSTERERCQPRCQRRLRCHGPALKCSIAVCPHDGREFGVPFPCGVGLYRVSGNPEGNQRVPSTLRFRKFPGKSEGVWSSILFLSNFPRETREFPESESWSGAKSEGKLRKSANYPGISRYTRKILGVCRFC